MLEIMIMLSVVKILQFLKSNYFFGETNFSTSTETSLDKADIGFFPLRMFYLLHELFHCRGFYCGTLFIFYRNKK